MFRWYMSRMKKVCQDCASVALFPLLEEQDESHDLIVNAPFPRIEYESRQKMQKLKRFILLQYCFVLGSSSVMANHSGWGIGFLAVVIHLAMILTFQIWKPVSLSKFQFARALILFLQFVTLCMLYIDSHFEYAVMVLFVHSTILLPTGGIVLVFLCLHFGFFVCVRTYAFFFVDFLSTATKVHVSHILFALAPFGVLVFSHDNTRNGFTLQWMKKRLQKRRWNQIRFIKKFAHCCRTYLNGINIFHLQLMHHNDNEDNEKPLKLLQENIHNTITLVNDLVDFHELKVKQLTLNNVVTDLTECIKKMMKRNEESLKQMKKTSLGIRFRMEKSVPKRVRFDPLRFSQVMDNLVSNGIKYTDRGFVSVVCFCDRIRRFGEDKIRFNFVVEDTGPGIPLDKLKDVFVPFQSITRSTKPSLGLGLVISKEITMLIPGGKLEIESKGEGCGVKATFSCDLDIVDEEEEKEGEGERGGKVRPPSRLDSQGVGRGMGQDMGDEYTDIPPEFSKFSVLVVEDVVTNRMAFGLQLEKFGIEDVFYAENGVDALETMYIADRQIKQFGKRKKKKKKKKIPGQDEKEEEEEEEEGEKEKESTSATEISYSSVSTEEEVVVEAEVPEQPPFDVVLMDINMPIMDGARCTEIIRTYWSKEEMPVYAVTAKIFMKADRKTYENRFNGIVRKPFKPKDIRAVLEEVVVANEKKKKERKKDTTPTDINFEISESEKVASVMEESIASQLSKSKKDTQYFNFQSWIFRSDDKKGSKNEEEEEGEDSEELAHGLGEDVSKKVKGNKKLEEYLARGTKVAELMYYLFVVTTILMMTFFSSSPVRNQSIKLIVLTGIVYKISKHWAGHFVPEIIFPFVVLVLFHVFLGNYVHSARMFFLANIVSRSLNYYRPMAIKRMEEQEKNNDSPNEDNRRSRPTIVLIMGTCVVFFFECWMFSWDPMLDELFSFGKYGVDGFERSEIVLGLQRINYVMNGIYLMQIVMNMFKLVLRMKEDRDHTLKVITFLEGDNTFHCNFAAKISHDLRTPIFSCKFLMSRLKAEFVEDRFYINLLRCLYDLHRETDNLVDFYRLNHKKFSYNERKLQLKELLVDAIKEYLDLYKLVTTKRKVTAKSRTLSKFGGNKKNEKGKQIKRRRKRMRKRKKKKKLGSSWDDHPEEQLQRNPVMISFECYQIPFVAIVDDERMDHIFINIISNAIEHTKSGSIKIKVLFVESGDQIISKKPHMNLKVDDDNLTPVHERSGLYFSVEDTGLGISEELQQNVFEKDFPFATKLNALGLGLHVSKEMLQQMGGDLVVTSVVGKGTRMEVFYPVKLVSIGEDPSAGMKGNYVYHSHGKKLFRTLEIPKIGGLLDGEEEDAIRRYRSPYSYAFSSPSSDENGNEEEKEKLRRRKKGEESEESNMKKMKESDQQQEKEIDEKNKKNERKKKHDVISHTVKSDDVNIKEEETEGEDNFNEEDFKESNKKKNGEDEDQEEEEDIDNSQRHFSVDYPVKICVVEDSIICMKMMKYYIEQVLGYTDVIYVTTGTKALRKVNNSIDVCFVDFFLPDMTAVDLIPKLQEVNDHTSFCLVTGNTTTAARELNVVFVPKPIKVTDVKSFISQVWKSKSIKKSHNNVGMRKYGME